jgi:2-polyprenyl-3-methyl-5-hydroxy-6-metoxy-1,4-benzoquinol methylase
MRETASDQELLELQQTLYASKNPTRRWLHEFRRDWILDALRRYRTEGMRHALEIGPGSGVYLTTLANFFDKVGAADVANAFLTQARRLADSHPNIDVIEDDIVHSKLPTGTFDLILCSEVIEHIADSGAALAQIGRIIKPDGVLILSTPQKYSLLELASKIAFLPGVIEVVRRIYQEPIIETGHINLLTAKAVREQLQRAGFSLKESHVGGLYLPIVAEFFGQLGLRSALAAERLLRRLDWTGVLWTQFYVAVRSG